MSENTFPTNESEDEESILFDVPEDGVDEATPPMDAFPSILADLAHDIQRVYQMPIVLPAMAALATISAAIGRSYVVLGASRRGPVTHGNLYIALCAEKGTGKGCAAKVVEPLLDYSREMTQRFNDVERIDLEKTAKRLETRIVAYEGALKQGIRKCVINGKAFDKQEEIEENISQLREQLLRIKPDGKAILRAPTLYEGDTTSEALIDTLVRNAETTFSYSPEAGQLLRVALGKYTDKGDFDLLLSGYSVEDYSSNRRSRDKVQLKPCISALWFGQPYLFLELIKDQEAFERGLTARTILIDTKAKPQHDDGSFPKIDHELFGRWRELIRSTLDVRLSMSKDDRIEVTCSKEAREVFRSYWNSVVDRRLGEDADISGELSRWVENAIKMALCFHVAIHGADCGSIELSEDTAKRAVKVMKWCALQYLELLKAGRAQRKRERLQKLLEHVKDNDGAISLRDLANSHGFERDEVENLSETHPEKIYIEKVQRKHGGRPSSVLKIRGKEPGDRVVNI